MYCFSAKHSESQSGITYDVLRAYLDELHKENVLRKGPTASKPQPLPNLSKLATAKVAKPITAAPAEVTGESHAASSHGQIAGSAKPLVVNPAQTASAAAPSQPPAAAEEEDTDSDEDELIGNLSATKKKKKRKRAINNNALYTIPKEEKEKRDAFQDGKAELNKSPSIRNAVFLCVFSMVSCDWVSTPSLNVFVPPLSHI